MGEQDTHVMARDDFIFNAPSPIPGPSAPYKPPPQTLANQISRTPTFLKTTPEEMQMRRKKARNRWIFSPVMSQKFFKRTRKVSIFPRWPTNGRDCRSNLFGNSAFDFEKRRGHNLYWWLVAFLGQKNWFFVSRRLINLFFSGLFYCKGSFARSA